jgi:ABC-2 type transport system permease protein
MPSSLTDPEMSNFVDYINRGKPTLIIDDPCPAFQPGLAPRNPKPRPGGMFGQGGPQMPKADNGHATKLSSALGIQWNTGQTVWDRTDRHPEIREMLSGQLADVVYIAPSKASPLAFNPDSRITRGLQEIMMFYPGSISPASGSNLKFEPLLESSRYSVTHEWDEYVTSSFFGPQLVDPPDSGSARDEKSRVIAAKISGQGAAGKDGNSASINVVFAAEMDMIANTFFYVRDKEVLNLKLDNVTFVLNAVDELAGEEALLTLRSRQPAHRSLTTIEARTNAFKTTQTDESAKAEEDAKKALDDANAALRKEVDTIDADKSLDPRTKEIKKEMVRRDKQRELDVLKVNKENEKKHKIKQVKDRTEREIRDVEGFAQNLAMFLPPIPALILGIFVFAKRAQGERQGVIPDRLVSRK